MTVHNRCATTLSCLEHLADLSFDQSRYSLAIFLTDDGCTDGTAEAVRQSYPAVRILPGDGNLFWNRGMFTAWTAAEKEGYDYYWWVNDDTFVFRDALSRLLAASERHLDKAVIVGSTCASDDSGAITYGGWKDGRVIVDLETEQACDTMNGNLVLIPASVLAAIGKNDPAYHHALGDLDYGLRAREAGLEIYVVSGICGTCDLHKKPVAWMDPEQSFRKRWDNFFSPAGNNPFEFFRFKRRHFGFFPACVSFLTNFIHLLFPSFWLKTKKHE